MTAATVTSLDATRDERRAALIELADLVDTEDHYCVVKPLSPVLGRLVPALASRKITDRDLVVSLFDQLVAAVAERRRFCSNEADWLAAHDSPNTDAVREAVLGRLESDVDSWANRLMGATS